MAKWDGRRLTQREGKTCTVSDRVWPMVVGCKQTAPNPMKEQYEHTPRPLGTRRREWFLYQWRQVKAAAVPAVTRAPAAHISPLSLDFLTSGCDVGTRPLSPCGTSH